MRQIAILFVAAVGVAQSAFAGSILIVNGANVTSESDTTSSITTNLTAKHVAVGNTVTVVNSVPANLSSFDQVWDIRFSNSSPLTVSDRSAYLSFAQSGKGIFAMGENDGFLTRNNSVIALVSELGGGSLSFITPNSTQTVLAPFTGPNPVSSITYLAPGGAGGASVVSGSGQFMTRDVNGNGTGIAWGKGKLANAAAGALTVVFDVNFMQTNADTNSQNFLANLIGFVNREVPPTNAVPVPAAFLSGMALLGSTLLGRARRVA